MRLVFDPSPETPSPAEGRTGALVRLAAIIGAVSSFACVPLALGLMGFEAALPPLLSGIGFAALLWLLRRGGLRSASSWLVGLCVVGTGFVHLANGGLAGWSYPLLVILPMLAVLVQPQSSRALGSRVGIAVLGLLAVSLAFPDAWWYADPPPSEQTIWLLRLGFQLLAVVGASAVATYAVARLEAALTEARATEHQATQAAERKTSFLANISHELRTPLNAILGYSELVLEDPSVTVLARRDVGRIHAAGQQLLELINEVLHHARLEASTPLAPETRRLDDLVADWLVAERGQLVARDGGAHVEVLGDPRRLAAVVGHIVEGHRRRGSARVELTTLVGDDGVAVTLHPASPPSAEAAGAPLPWLLAERTAAALGISVHRAPDGRFTLVLPRPDASQPRPWLGGGALALRPESLPADPMRALRAQLSHRLAWISLGILTLVAPVLVALYDGGPEAALAVMGWAGLIASLIGLQRAGHHRVANLGLAIGQILVLTVVVALFGGSHGFGMVFFPTVAVLGTLIVGSRGGYAVLALAVACVGGLAVADDLALLPASAPDPRAQVMLGTAVATWLTAALVATWAGRLERLVTSARHAAQRAEEADRATSAFLDVVSMELRTPLNAVLGYAELLLEERPVSAEVRDDLQHIIDAGRHLLTVVDDLLDMSAIVSDQLEVEPREVELQPLLASVLTVVEPMVERGRNVLRAQVDAEVACVVADPKRLRQILLNLLSNAAKFTSDGSVDVLVTASAADEVRIAVRDTGIGIAESELPHLFQPFRQVHHESPGRYGGTGLGLAISRRLARLMGGDIEARSALGHGSEFTLSLRHEARQGG